jgi:chromosome segregation ATPase
MSDLTKIIRDGAARVAALDFTAENERISELRAEIAKLDAGIERGTTKLHEIGRQLSGKPSVDSTAVADALLDEGETALLAPNREMLDAERSGLQVGLRDLRQRRENAVLEVDKIRRECRQKAGQQLASLVPVLETRAKAAAAELVEIYAIVEGLKSAFDLPIHGLSSEINFAVDGCAGYRRLVSGQAVDVPAYVSEAFAKLPTFGPALEIRMRNNITMPVTPAMLR